MTKLDFQRKTIGVRRRGKPRNKLFDKVQEDRKRIKVKDWREKLQNKLKRIEQ